MVSKDMLQSGEGISHASDPKAAADFIGVCITGLDMFVIVLYIKTGLCRNSMKAGVVVG